MTDYDNTNRGAIFKNEKKENPKAPDFGGKLNVDGKDYFIDGWRYDARDGKKAFISLKVKLMEKQGAGRRTEVKEKLDDEVPF
jgi:hypothetical protein